MGALNMRVSFLECARRHDGDEDIAAKSGTLSNFLSFYDRRSQTPEELKKSVLFYLSAVRSVPAWAVREGLQYWNSGQHGEGTENYSFPPQPPQVARLAAIAFRETTPELKMLRKEIADRESERVIDPATKKKVGDLMEGFAEELRGAGA